MKIKNVFGLFLIITFLITAIGAFPASTHNVVSTMLVKGPQAEPANVTASGSSASYGLFTCQVGLDLPVVCYDPYQMRHAYNIDTLINAGFTGKGKTIVIVDAFQDANLIDDLNYFNSFYGLPSLNGLGGKNNPKLGTFKQIAPYGLGPVDDGWAGEITLDVEWAHAIAPGANITLVLAKSNDDVDILNATKYAVDHNLGDVISQSFGEDESCVDPKLLAQQHQVFVNATKKNITIFASSGDQGAAQPTCDGSSYSKAASNPASDPLVTAVGGTELHAADYCLTALGCDPTANPAAGTYQGEIAWNEPDSEYGDMATGGGFSLLYDAPLYQKTMVPGKQLGVPDVAYDAAVYHGVLTRFYGSWYLFGGTSAGSPQWAAITVIANQKAGHNLGFINPALYLLGSMNAVLHQSGKEAYLHDITIGNNSVIEKDASNNDVTVQGFNAGPDWDATTGLGSPISDQMIKSLITMSVAFDLSKWLPHSPAHSPSHGHVHEH
jgi:subtilase family serine protease